MFGTSFPGPNGPGHQQEDINAAWLGKYVVINREHGQPGLMALTGPPQLAPDLCEATLKAGSSGQGWPPGHLTKQSVSLSD